MTCPPPVRALLGLVLLTSCTPAPTLAPAVAFDGTRAGELRELLGVSFAFCPAGSFDMGSSLFEPERRPDEDQVRVTLTKGMWMAAFETTQGEWKQTMGPLPGPPTDELPLDDALPVGNVHFAQAESYAAAMTARARDAGVIPADWEFRLPTEAQWEYAARAGTTTATAFGNSLGHAQANFSGAPYRGGGSGTPAGRALPGGRYAPNAWNLYDFHGNTYEWTRDWYRTHVPGGVDPDLHDDAASATPSEGGALSRVRRGGGWGDSGWACRSAFRLRFEPERGYDHIGFRIVLVRL